MDENSAFKWILGAFAGVLGWLGIQVHRKAMAAVSREELAVLFEELRKERKEMHEENKASIARVHDRLDELWKSM